MLVNYFDDYIIKILNNDETNIFDQYMSDFENHDKYKTLFIYMPNKTITIENLKSCERIYFVDKYINININIFKLLNSHKYSCKTLTHGPTQGRLGWSRSIKPTPITKHVSQQFKQRLQDTFTILYYIFTKHNNVYLPELSKYIFFMYFDVICNN